MLEGAKCLKSPACLRGDALMLPFPIGAFYLVALITMLEFLADPIRAPTEAIRVAGEKPTVVWRTLCGLSAQAQYPFPGVGLVEHFSPSRFGGDVWVYEHVDLR
jgi:hypothetical protein